MKRSVQLLIDVEVDSDRDTKRQAEQRAKEQFRPRELCFGIHRDRGYYSVKLKRATILRDKTQ